MSTSIRRPPYIPPPTTFIISQSGAYASRPPQNRHWNVVRDQIRNGGVQQANGHPDPVQRNGRYDDGKPTIWNVTQQMRVLNNRRPINGEMNGKTGDLQGLNEVRANKIHTESEPGRHDFYAEEDQQIENQQFYDAAPDLAGMFDEADRRNQQSGLTVQGDGSKSRLKRMESASNGGVPNGDNKSDNFPWQRSYDDPDDVDWQMKEERGTNKGSERKRRTGNSVYDPQRAKMRTQSIDQQRMRQTDSRRPEEFIPTPMEKESESTDSSELQSTTIHIAKENDSGNESGNSVRKKSYSDDMSESANGGESKYDDEEEMNEEQDEEEYDEQEGSADETGEKQTETDENQIGKKKRKGLYSVISKCSPKFAEKLLDAIEKQKGDCQVHFDDICKKYREKNGKPIFTSYSCESGGNDCSLQGSMKKIRSLFGGFYTKACAEMENISNSIDDWLDEEKPEEDGTWSNIEGENGIRCVSHYDNRIEDRAIYPCCCCFNEVVEKDAHVGVKYLVPQFGCDRPAVVIRSFENRPYFCERILASMSEKRRECFLKRVGKKHNMKGGVHCVSVIPSMENEADRGEGRTGQKEENDREV